MIASISAICAARWTTLIALVIGVFTAYALSRFDFRGKYFVIGIILGGSLLAGVPTVSFAYDAEDGFFYDLDKHGRHVKVQSDLLLRVLACEIGDDEFFAQALDRYLLNTRKFFAKYPFTSIALDDPRYDPAYDYNSWAGPSNFLSLIRAPHAFEAQ